jgi:hypothetical protein
VVSLYVVLIIWFALLHLWILFDGIWPLFYFLFYFVAFFRRSFLFFSTIQLPSGLCHYIDNTMANLFLNAHGPFSVVRQNRLAAWGWWKVEEHVLCNVQDMAQVCLHF